MKKSIISTLLCAALCLGLGMNALAAGEINSAGGEGTSESVLSQAQTAFSVTLPTSLPVAVTADGTISTASSARITNNSFGPVKVEGVQLIAQNGWTLADFSTDFSKKKVGIKEFGFQLQGQNSPTDGNISADNWSDIGGGQELEINYDANIAVQNVSVNETIANVIFTMGWSDAPITTQNFTVTKDNRSQVGYTGAEGEVLHIPTSFTGENGEHYTVTAIANSAFYCCTSLKEVFVPSSVKSIGEAAFGPQYSWNDNVYSDLTIHIDAANGSISGSPWGASGAVIDYSLSPPQDDAFGYDFIFDESKNITGLAVSALLDKSKSVVTVPDSVVCDSGEYAVKQINYGAFQNLGTTTEVNIGKNVTNISSGAFHSASYGSGKLLKINVDECNPQYASIDGALYNKAGTVLYVCPSGIEGTFTIPDTVVTVADYAFQVGKLSKIIMGANVRNGMDYYVDYYMMYSLENISVSENNQYYSDIDGVLYNKAQTVLYKCPEKKSGVISISGKVTQIGTSAFRSCYRITQMNIYKPAGSLTYASWDTNWGATNATINWLG